MLLSSHWHGPLVVDSIDIRTIRRYQKRHQKKIGECNVTNDSLSAQCWLIYGCSLPFQIGSEVSEEAYNTFLDQNTSKGYKFYWNNGNVYIVGMATSMHEAIVILLNHFFHEPNGGEIYNPPIYNALQSCKKSLTLLDLLDLWIITFYIFSYRSSWSLSYQKKASSRYCNPPEHCTRPNPFESWTSSWRFLCTSSLIIYCHIYLIYFLNISMFT
jgi:hypothetical protein